MFRINKRNQLEKGLVIYTAMPYSIIVKFIEASFLPNFCSLS